MNLKSRVSAVCCAMALVISAHGASVELETEEQKLSYAIGFSFGQLIMQQFGPQLGGLDTKILSQAIGDVLGSAEPAMSMNDIQEAMTEWQMKQQEVQAAEQEALSKSAEESSAAGAAFMKENGARKGVVTTESGLQYEIVTAGDGAKPTADDTVEVHYRGTLIDGTEFDSSYKRNTPASFPVGGVIVGWQEALQLMPVGSKWKVFIPSNLGYGERGAGGSIGPNAALIFEVELLKIM